MRLMCTLKMMQGSFMDMEWHSEIEATNWWGNCTVKCLETKKYEVGGCWNIESSLKESCYLVAFGLVQQNRLRLLLVVLWLYIYYFMYCSEMKNKKRPFSNHMSYFTYLVNITSCCVLQVPPIPLHNFYFLTEHEKWNGCNNNIPVQSHKWGRNECNNRKY